jgi:hypothetical protein
VPFVPDAEGASSLEALLRRIAAVQETVGKSGDIVQAASNRDDFDRSFIAPIVLLAYIGAIGAGFILFAIRGLHAPDAATWTDIVKDATDLIKTAVLPIVTLVLGYYFGKSSKT